MANGTNMTPEIAKKVASARYLGMNGTDVVGVGVGTKVVSGVDTLIPCVKFYVSRKTAPGELPLVNLLPDDVLGVPTDVVDVGRAFGPRINARRIRPPAGERLVGPGDSIGPHAADASNVSLTFSGTLGAVLQRAGDDRQRFLLSNNHVLSVNGRIPVGSPIVAPGQEDALGTVQKTIGHLAELVPLTRKENFVDCAIAAMEDPDGVNFIFPDGRVVGGWAAPQIGLSVIKFGKASGCSQGKIVDVSADILVDYSFGTFLFVDQILIDGGEDDFAQDGDSGALLITAPNHVARYGRHAAHTEELLPAGAPAEAVGLVFAPAGRFAAACPISVVLDQLELLLGYDLEFATSDVRRPTSASLSAV
jgi:hypothetical protein